MSDWRLQDAWTYNNPIPEMPPEARLWQAVLVRTYLDIKALNERMQIYLEKKTIDQTFFESHIDKRQIGFGLEKKRLEFIHTINSNHMKKICIFADVEYKMFKYHADKLLSWKIDEPPLPSQKTKGPTTKTRGPYKLRFRGRDRLLPGNS